MSRTELLCSRCKQVNIRYSGWAGAWSNPRMPWLCTLCSTPLDGTARDVGDIVRAATMWTAVYVMHVLAGIGIVLVLVSLAWPGLINQPLPVPVAPIATGAVAGLLLARWSRHRGTLLGNRRR